MNQQIQELLEQAGVEVWYDDNSGQTVFSGDNIKQLETFAQLIVQECIDRIETYRIPVGNSAVGEMACEWTYDALKEIRDNIKQHFGVE